MRNPFGTLKRVNLEWGRTARKQEDHERGFRRRGRDEAIEEQVAEMEEEEQ